MDADLKILHDLKKEELQRKYPNTEIIIGGLTAEDKPVPVNVRSLEETRIAAVDGAVKYVYGKYDGVKNVDLSLWFLSICVVGMVGLTLTLYNFGLWGG